MPDAVISPTHEPPEGQLTHSDTLKYSSCLQSEGLMPPRSEQDGEPTTETFQQRINQLEYKVTTTEDENVRLSSQLNDAQQQHAELTLIHETRVVHFEQELIETNHKISTKNKIIFDIFSLQTSLFC